MAMIRVAIMLVLCAPALALAQEAPPDAAAPQPALDPPRALGSTDIPLPPGAPPITSPVVVTVKLLVDKDGAVQNVTLVSEPQPGFDEAVIEATRRFRFAPATVDGKPVKVEITFTHTFTPPPPPPAPTTQGPARTAVLSGRLVELGTRAPVTSATVTAEIDGATYAVDADDDGRFRLDVPAGTAKVAVHAPAHKVFLQQETLADKQEVSVAYYIERDRYDPYEIVVRDEQRREEVSRVTLRGREIQQVPGTFGDPYRVVQSLPGVASVASLLPMPVVRGSSPGATGALIDGTRVPLLFHMLGGPSVIHPEIIDEVQFFPGGAPASYGGYTGGIVDGRTRRARPGERLVDVDVNLLQAGGLVRQPITNGITVTAAARYGYPGYLLSLATDQLSLSYWDYQLRLDGGTKANGWTVFAFGANDTLETVAANADPDASDPALAPSLTLGFHRLDARYVQTRGRFDAVYRVVGGYDRTFSAGTDFTSWLVEPEVHARWTYDKHLTLAAGVEGSARTLDQGAAASSGGFNAITAKLSSSSSASGFVDALWRPTTNWLIRPGLRATGFHDSTATKYGVEPRLSARYKLGERELADAPPGSDERGIWLKGAAGIYHQPPRFVLPLPGLDQMPLQYGLLRAYQTSVGVEAPLARELQLSSEVFFNYLDPTVFDLSTNASSLGDDANTSLFPTSDSQNDDMLADRLTTPQVGRAYGLEVMLKRVARNGLFGWVSYTVSRSERRKDGEWAPYDYDRTHLANVVAGLPLPRNWDIGVRASYQSGLPATTTAGANTARADGYLRFDVRVDKRAVLRSWLLDFYIDITNVALLPEEVSAGTTIRYVLPTLGLRGRF